MFQFSLEAVLKARATQEKVAQARFAIFNKKRAELLRGIDEIERRIESAKEDLSAYSAQGIFGLFEHKRTMEGLNILKEQLVAKQEELRVFDVEYSKEREKLAETVKKRKIMEKLREKELAEYKTLQNRRELAFFDEINASRHFTQSPYSHENVSPDS